VYVADPQLAVAGGACRRYRIAPVVVTVQSDPDAGG
jgi:hypothetical protein